MKLLFGLQQAVHFCAAIQSLLSFNLMLWRHMAVLVELASTVIVLLMISVYMYQWDIFLNLLNFSTEGS